jgi:hypothetical protein
MREEVMNSSVRNQWFFRTATHHPLCSLLQNRLLTVAALYMMILQNRDR